MTGHRHPRPTGGDCEGGVHFDIFDIHPYTTGGPTHEGGINDVELGDLPKLQELLLAADRAGRIKGQFKRTPLWVTELSWDSNPPDPGGLSMTIESQWTAEALYRSWSAGVSNFFWFSLVDFEPEPNVPPSQTLQSGLYFWAPAVAARQPKEVLYAFRFPLVAFPRRGGLFFWGRTPTSRRGRVVRPGGKGRRLGQGRHCACRPQRHVYRRARHRLWQRQAGRRPRPRRGKLLAGLPDAARRGLSPAALRLSRGRVSAPRRRRARAVATPRPAR